MVYARKVTEVLGQDAGSGSGSDNDGGRAVPNSETAAVSGPGAAQEQAGAQQAAEPSGSRWKLRNWPLRTKLAVVLIIPLVTALTFGGLRAVGELNSANEFQRTADQFDVAARVTTVVQQLQGERTLAVARMANGSADRAALDAQIAKVDGAVQELRSAVENLDLPDEATQQNYDQALQRLTALEPLRAKINNTAFPDLAAFVTYTSILSDLLQLGREVNLAVTDRELLRRGTTVQALGEAKEFVARQNAALQIAAGRDVFPADLLERTFAAQASAYAAIDSFNANATLDEQQLYADRVAGAEVDNRERIVATAFARAAASQDLNINVGRLTADGRATTDMMRQVESTLLDRLRAQASALASDATDAAWVFFTIVVVALIGTVVLMLVIARALTKPLRQLRSSALEVAYVRLPETVRRILADPNPMEASRNAVAPVPVNSREEIGEVARSFDVVHERAIRMAAEQALLRENVNGIFVNLSRRSQRLVERQLGVIDRLEADEQDPDQLASLFELDHLATRLRRNGESLLVLSGAGLTKSVSKPVPSADVIGAAVSEIEQYARVEVGAVPDVAVQGRAVHDLVHLLAELLDNATYFSEPETKISVRAVVTRRHALAVQITDRGVGMTEEQIAEANERLADPPDLDVSVTRRMGLYVVARLAKRHGIEVRLRENEDIEGGVIARVVVPTELLTSAPQPVQSSPRPSVPEQRSEMSFPSIPPAGSDPEETTMLPPAQPPVPPAPAVAQPAPDENGLTPLDKPISLDDLVAGQGKAAGPFVSPNQGPAPNAAQPPPRPRTTEPQWPSESPDAVPSNGAAASPFQLPKREPRGVSEIAHESRYESENEQPSGEGSALDDDVPTKRLPIYQSVLSRWFSEETTAGPDSSDEEGWVDSQDGDTMSEQDRPDPVPPAGDTGWRSVSDTGWQAAHALLESKGEEVTPAGLPKRVPNAYLVPGSVSPTRGDGFTDTTAGEPGQGAIARSAEAARSRMASFQRGYQSGRHALKEPPAQGEQFDEAGAGPRHNGAKE